MLVSWNTTNQCNMFCDHCYRDAGVKLEEELTTTQGKTLIDQIKEAGFRMMIMSGGEPLMRPDIFELCAYAVSRGLRTVMGTNGTLITPRVADELRQSGLAACAISLDSIVASEHDAFRKLEGAYDLALQGMANLKRAGIPFQINTTVMDWNLKYLDAITDKAIDLGARAHHLFFLVPTGRATSIEQEALRVKEYERTLHRIMEKQKHVAIEIKPTCAPQFVRVADAKGIPVRFTRGCLAGISYCIISPTGDVQPCAYLDLRLGNVKHESFADIWRQNPVFKELRSQQYGGKCGCCEYTERCGGCRARAYYYSGGDYMAQDDWCLYQPRGWSDMDQVDIKILNYLQEGITLSPRPFLDMARELGISEETILARIEALRDRGLIRRLGGVFDSPRMGMKSTLCAMEVPEARIPEVAQQVNAYREVTHNYLRNDVYNMWFTVTASSGEDLERILQEIESYTGIKVISMPVRQRYKIKVAFALNDET